MAIEFVDLAIQKMVQGGAPASYKLVYNPNNYRYNLHKP